MRMGEPPDPELTSRMLKPCMKSHHPSVHICQKQPKTQFARGVHRQIKGLWKKLEKREMRRRKKEKGRFERKKVGEGGYFRKKKKRNKKRRKKQRKNLKERKKSRKRKRRGRRNN